MGFMDHLFSLRRRRKTATTTARDTVKPASEERTAPRSSHQQQQEQQPQQQKEEEQEEEQPATSSMAAMAPSSLASSSVNVDSLEFAESRDLVFLLGNTLDEQQPKCPMPSMNFPQFEYLLQQTEARTQGQAQAQAPTDTRTQSEPAQDDGASPPRRSGSTLRSNRLFHALPVSKNNFRLSLTRSSRRGLKNARSTPNFDTDKSRIL